MRWRKGDTAPKDGNPFAARIDGYPFIVFAVWNAPSSEWCYTMLQANLYHGKWNDCCFENEYCKETELVRWLDMEETK